MARPIHFSDALSIMAFSTTPSSVRRTSLDNSASQSTSFDSESSPFCPLDLSTAASDGDLETVRKLVKSPDPANRPTTLAEFLGALKLEKYLRRLEEKKIDLHLFLQLSDADLSKFGIKLLGPRKKIANAIARYHSHGPIPDDYESQLAYANYQRQKCEEHKYNAEKLAKELRRVQEEMQRLEEDLRLVRRQASEQQKALHFCNAATKESRLATQKALLLLRSTSDLSLPDVRKQAETYLAKIAANCDRHSLKLAEIRIG